MPDLPTGTITFLFTDIEGSTHLWEHQPEAMKAALERHNSLLRQAIEANNGHVFKTVGDAFCAVFTSAPDALVAALTAQRALLAETWPKEVAALRVRMALHTGTVEGQEGDYLGPPLNRVARILTAGHGGQILLSHATQELVRDHLPPKASLFDMGEHRLKDLFRPERLFQLYVPDLPVEFPPLRTLDARLTNLPAQSTPFIGRERELAAVLDLLRRPAVRLITLTGAGGTGKTRLALQVSADLLDEYHHGIYLVALDTITDPDLVLPTIASILGVREAASQPLIELIMEYLSDRQMLLVLDNFEQVIEAAPVVTDLLRAASRLKILVSSREVLHVYGEYNYPVPPLGLPEIKRKQTVAVLSQYEAVALFIERAKAAKADFEITEENAPAIAEICIRLDGLPLAIELAAARSRMLSPQAILGRLSDRLRMLTGGARNLPTRQQTLRGAIDWSYDLLDEGEKMLFTRLGVFVGGWKLEAAEAVCAAGLPMDVADGLESLLDKSLIRQIEGACGGTRFTMLDTLREYAAEKLDASEEAEMIHATHTDTFTALAEEAAPRLIGPEQIVWLDRLDEELDNIRAVIRWALTQQQPEPVLRIGALLWRFAELRSHVGETLGWMAQGLALPGDVPVALRALALRAYGNLAWLQPSAEGARTAYEESLALYRQLGDREGIAASLNNVGNICMDEGDHYCALAYFQESLAMDLKIGNQQGAAIAYANIGDIYEKEGDFAQAHTFYERARTLFRKQDKPDSVGFMASAIGALARRTGDDALAHSLLEESLASARKLGAKYGIVMDTGRLGWLALQEGDEKKARAYLEESLGMYLDSQSEIAVRPQYFIPPLEASAQLSAKTDPARSARLWGAAEVLYENHHIQPTGRERDARARAAADLRARLGDQPFEVAWAEGKAMPLLQAIQQALEAVSE